MIITRSYSILFTLYFTTLISIFPISSIYSKNAVDEVPIVVIIPSYNNRLWCRKNLESIFNQNYSNYRIIYINDASQDSTLKNVKLCARENGFYFRSVNFDDSRFQDIPKSTNKFSSIVNAKPHFITIVNNRNRCGAMANFYRAIHSCRDDEVVVIVDGDDWLYHDNVFKELNEIYNAENIWLTHGRLIEYPENHSTWCEPIPQKIIDNNAFRSFKCPSHLRTFYAWLFKKVKLEDFLYENEFFKMTCDMAMMYPMIEMAGDRHAFISKINYVYNTKNPMNDNKVDPELQNTLDHYIKQLPPYHKLK